MKKDKLFQVTMGTGSGKAYMSSQLIRELFLKNKDKTPEEEAKKKRIKENNRRGWVR